MNRLRVLVVVLALLAATAGTAAPAGAHANACVFQGVWITSQPMYFAALGSGATGWFTFIPVTGTCAFDGLEMYGAFSGWCDTHSGSGVVEDPAGHPFSYLVAGSAGAFTGPGAVGSVEIYPDAINGETCLLGADRFLAVVTVTLV